MTGKLILFAALLRLAAANGPICDVETILTQCPNIVGYILEMESERRHKTNIGTSTGFSTINYWPEEDYETTETDTNGMDFEDSHGSRRESDEPEPERPQRGFQSLILRNNRRKVVEAPNYAVIGGQVPVDNIWNVITGQQFRVKCGRGSQIIIHHIPDDFQEEGAISYDPGLSRNQWDHGGIYAQIKPFDSDGEENNRRKITREFKQTYSVHPLRNAFEEPPEKATDIDNFLTWGSNGYRRIGSYNKENPYVFA